LKLERVAGDFAITSAAVQVGLDKDGVCNEIGIGVTGAAAVPLKARAAENLLKGKRPTAQLIDEAVQVIQERADPIEDLRGSASYKRKALGAVLRRALVESLRRAEAMRK
jgi:carbon-monoxide dehydrogenase medium subunit